MNATWRLLTLFTLVSYAEAKCSPTSYYKNCWIRRFPGIYINIEESQRRGAQLLKFYQEDTALKCSRTCCLTRNFSCNLAIFHYDTTQENVNCFHLHCPTLESCILSHRGNVVLYNITEGVDPDLLVFGKYFTPDVRVLPHHYSRPNASDPLPHDKRQFIRPAPAPAPQPRTTQQPKNTITTASRTESITTVTRTESITTATRAESIPTATRTESITTATRTELFTMETPTESVTTEIRPHPTDQSNKASTTKTTDFILALTPPATFDKHEASTFQSSSAKPTTLESAIPTNSSTSSNQSTTIKSAASSDGLANMEISKHKSNDTKWSQGRNHSVVSEDGHTPAGGGDPWGDLGPGGWQVATHTVLVAVAICVTLLLGCCCSVVLVFSWRGHRKRMGRYRTSWRGKKGSMRLIKYVLVKDSS